MDKILITQDIVAEGEAETIRIVNEAAEAYFAGNAQIFRKPYAVEKAISGNTKFIVPAGSDPVNVISEMAGIVPLKK